MAKKKELTLKERFEVLQEFIARPPQTPGELYGFCVALTGEQVVHKNVCPDHNTPWDFIWNSYRIDIPEFKATTKRNIIAMGPRGGEKTLSQAKLVAMELLTKPNCNQVSLAAIDEQNKRGFQYLSKFLKSEPAVNLDMIEKLVATEVSLFNGSGLQLACGTLAGSNSKHCPKMRIDEVELMKPGIIEECKMIPKSMGQWTMHTSYVSTRKEIDGTMEYMLGEAKKRNYGIVTWCVLEMAEPCPEERRGRAKKSYVVQDIENPGETLLVEAWEGCGTAGRDGGPCELLAVCKGDLAYATGRDSIDDMVENYINEDRIYYIAQRLCRTPKRGNMFFEDFSEKLQASTPFDYNPEYPVDFSIDFSNGGESPTVFWIVQEDQHGEEWVLATLYFRRKPTEVIAAEVQQFCLDLGIKYIRMQIGDSANTGEIRNLNAANPDFFHIIPCSKIRRDEGWPLIRRLVMDNSGRRRLHINPKFCKAYIKEILEARRAKSNADDISNLCETHGLDAHRYYEIKMHGPKGEPRMRLLEPGANFKPTIILPGDEGHPLTEKKPNPESSGTLDRQIMDWLNED